MSDIVKDLQELIAKHSGDSPVVAMLCDRLRDLAPSGIPPIASETEWLSSVLDSLLLNAVSVQMLHSQVSTISKSHVQLPTSIDANVAGKLFERIGPAPGGFTAGWCAVWPVIASVIRENQ